MNDTLEMPVMSERDELIGMYSDTYKDAHGIRPRWMKFDNMSNEEIHAGIEANCAEAERVAKLEEIYANEKVEEFKLLIKKTIEMGAGDEETALRWLSQEEKFYHGQCVEQFVWNYGILFTDYGRGLVKKLLDIVKYEPDVEYC